MTDQQDGKRVEVLIVGAGPTGLLLAGELERRGISCHLIDARPAPLNWDRATVIHPRSLQIFEAMGLADRVLAAGCRQRVIKIHSDGKQLGMMDLAFCGSVYGFNVGLSEEVTENILTDYLRAHGGEVNRSSRLIGLAQQPEGVLAEIERDGVRYQMNAQWVVGCDGVHSATREQFGIAMAGEEKAKLWAVFDVTMSPWRDTYEGTFVYLDTPPVILTALPKERWRVYLRPTSEESDLIADAMGTLTTYLPDSSFVEVENPNRFHCHTKVATRFRAGPVFLAGDAAHVCSPTEGHGMNRGLQDAFNLAWKLALVCKGADPVLLDSYEIERKPAAEMVIESGNRFEKNLTMTDPVERANRNQAIRETMAEEKTRHHEIVAETELNVDYSGSPIVWGDGSGGLAAGNRLSDMMEVKTLARGRCRLVELTQRVGHTLLLVAGGGADDAKLVELDATVRDFAAQGELFEAAFTFALQADSNADIGEIGKAEAGELGVGGVTLFAVRPDGYVGLRADKDHVQALKRYRGLILEGTREAFSAA
jgi:2-polyprenyl-6-methoxyphenol hydroxylase-like FAD-dependent oxidoreductase